METFEKELERIALRYRHFERAMERERFIESLRDRRIVLFGAAAIGDLFFERLHKHGIPIECFCDNHAKGTTPAGYAPIIGPDELITVYPDATIVISNNHSQNAIEAQLLALGFSRDRIIKYPFRLLATRTWDELAPFLPGYAWAYDFFEEDASKRIILETISCHLLGQHRTPSSSPQYFERNIISLSTDEVFVDGGLFTGDTVQEFYRQSNGKYRHIYGFDADPHMCALAAANLERYPNVDIVTQGLYCREDTLRFKAAGEHVMHSCGSIVQYDGDNVLRIPVTSLDAFFAARPDASPPTFIKMDIEGAERDALLGCERIIREHRPKLAISVYHKWEDMHELPRYIHAVRPDYRFALRHYTDSIWDTVLFAT